VVKKILEVINKGLKLTTKDRKVQHEAHKGKMEV